MVGVVGNRRIVIQNPRVRLRVANNSCFNPVLARYTPARCTFLAAIFDQLHQDRELPRPTSRLCPIACRLCEQTCPRPFYVLLLWCHFDLHMRESATPRTPREMTSHVTIGTGLRPLSVLFCGEASSLILVSCHVTSQQVNRQSDSHVIPRSS